MYLTQKKHLPADKQTYKILKRLTRLSKNLYNFTLYNIRQYFFNYGKYLNKDTAYHTVKENDNYKLLPSQVAQNTIETVDGSMKSFFKLLDKKRKGEYEKPISLPNYLCRNYDKILIGDYTPSKDVSPHKKANRSILNQTLIAKLRGTIEWVCDKSGKTFKKVDEKNTTKKCCICGET